MNFVDINTMKNNECLECKHNIISLLEESYKTKTEKNKLLNEFISKHKNYKYLEIINKKISIENIPSYIKDVLLTDHNFNNSLI